MEKVTKQNSKFFNKKNKAEKEEVYTNVADSSSSTLYPENQESDYTIKNNEEKKESDYQIKVVKKDHGFFNTRK